MNDPLSPGTQKLFDASNNIMSAGTPQQRHRECLAAFARALADEVCPADYEPLFRANTSELTSLWNGITITNQSIREKILDIATELYPYQP